MAGGATAGTVAGRAPGVTWTEAAAPRTLLGRAWRGQEGRGGRGGAGNHMIGTGGARTSGAGNGSGRKEAGTGKDVAETAGFEATGTGMVNAWTGVAKTGRCREGRCRDV